jgi:hypothetical protein
VSTLRKRLRQLRVPAADLDLDRLREFCAGQPDVTAIGEVTARQEVSVVGEIDSLRIVPRAGSPSLEATVTDGSGSLDVVWTGRRRIAGVSPGRRLVLHGRAGPHDRRGRLIVYNPSYELL